MPCDAVPCDAMPCDAMPGALGGIIVKEVVCGTHHTACVTENYQVYTWGSGEYAPMHLRAQPRPPELRLAVRALLKGCVRLPKAECAVERMFRFWMAALRCIGTRLRSCWWW